MCESISSLSYMESNIEPKRDRPGDPGPVYDSDIGPNQLGEQIAMIRRALSYEETLPDAQYAINTLWGICIILNGNQDIPGWDEVQATYEEEAYDSEYECRLAEFMVLLGFLQDKGLYMPQAPEDEI